MYALSAVDRKARQVECIICPRISASVKIVCIRPWIPSASLNIRVALDL